MELFFDHYLKRLERLHRQIGDALNDTSPEVLDWSPGAEMNSLAVLVTHVCGSERYWIGDVALGEPSNRDRDAEFRARGMDAASLISRLESTLEFARGGLDRLALPDLEKAVSSPRDGKITTVGESLLHALEHTALHLGHIQLTRQLWESRKA